MSICRCPDCVNVRDRTLCRTCMGSAYVHRNTHGRITHPADPKDFYDQETKGKRDVSAGYGFRR